MATILLIVIYIAFIGLGIPDSLFGTAWPAIYPEFGLPVSAASFVPVLVSCGTFVASLMSARLINRFGAGKITAASTAMTALALLGFSLSHHLAALCLLAIPLGLGAGAIDAALNNYVAIHYQAAHMNFIACFYGIGITLSPYLMSFALSGQGGWRGGYRFVSIIQILIALLTILSLPLWQKAGAAGDGQPDTAPRTVPLRELAKQPSIWLVWLIFFGSCAIEYTCNTWGSTFLITAKGMAAGQAAQMITVYYVGMTLGRFLSGVLSRKVKSWDLIRMGQGVVLAAILLILLPLPTAAAVAGFFLVGLGNGPVFPNLVHLTPRNFGEDISQSVMGSQMAAANSGILFMPPVFGLLAQAFGAWLFPWYLLALFALMLVPTLLSVRRLKKQGRY